LFTVAQYAVEHNLTAEAVMNLVLSCEHTGNHNVAPFTIRCIAALSDAQIEIIAEVVTHPFGHAAVSQICCFAWGSWYSRVEKAVSSSRISLGVTPLFFHSGIGSQEAYRE